jgi:perosamine synthetase
LQEVLYSGQISEGLPVQEFEAKFGSFVGSNQVLSFYSGTAALHTALILAGVKPGDEVISTAMTAEPTNMSILHAGGKIIWGDVDPANGNLLPESVDVKISERTKAILLVHYGGIPASIRAIRNIAERYQIPVIEDAAHALGAHYEGRPLGTHSEYVMFSLQAIKHMTTVDGGMLVCREPADLPLGRMIRWFGIDRQASRTEVDVKIIGYKYHMNNVTATIGLAQLEYVEKIIQRHIDNGKYFDHALQGVAGLKTCTWDDEAEPSYWFYTVLAERRDDLARALTASGIGNSQAHKRNDLHSVFSESRAELPGLDAFYGQMLHIPCGWWVSDDDRAAIVDVIRKGW